jgi:hypothetical protein
MTRNPILRAVAGVFAGLLASSALAAPAHAGVLTTSATDCHDGVVTQPFAAWHDASYYKSVATFEHGTAGWTLTGGAKVAAGNEPWHVGATGDSASLALPAGSTATTPPVCVGLSEPTLRFFTRRDSGLLSTLAVTVQVQTSLGLWVTVPLGADLGGAWHPSAQMLVVANLLPLLPPDRTAVRFTFAPLLGGSWRVDDVYVDPLHRAA